jgi:hypothetical protein
MIDSMNQVMQQCLLVMEKKHLKRLQLDKLIHMIHSRNTTHHTEMLVDLELESTAAESSGTAGATKRLDDFTVACFLCKSFAFLCAATTALASASICRACSLPSSRHSIESARSHPYENLIDFT